jgi:hypothetical protein
MPVINSDTESFLKVSIRENESQVGLENLQIMSFQHMQHLWILHSKLNPAVSRAPVINTCIPGYLGG